MIIQIYVDDIIFSSTSLYKDTAPPKAQHSLANSLFSKIVQDMEVHFDMTIRQKAIFECLRAPHAQDILMTIPIDGLCQHMSPVEYRAILKYRLMIPLFPADETCPVCRKPCLDSFEEHATHCKDFHWKMAMNAFSIEILVA